MFLVLGFVVFFGSLTGCAKRFDIVDDQREFHAYGQEWKYTSIEHRSQSWGLFTGHGYIGQVDRVRQEITLETESGGKIDVADRLYALQKDGVYKKVECCYNFDTLATVGEIEERLFIQFLQKRSNVTNCSVGAPGNDEDRLLTRFFGEFDAEKGVFYVRSVADNNENLENIMGPNWKLLMQKESIEETRKRQYRYRIPFICKEP